MLEGTLKVRLGRGAAAGARRGATWWSRPATCTPLANPSAEPVRFLNLSTPGGLERYLRELAADPSDFANIAARHDVIPA